jgi:bifunctional N-acetylglucosamine-1-phosphate-uridyltransferase/glucosamine-1-phosphate-acetyltransferase GlmU-like protein
MRARINGGWMRHVSFHDAESTVIEPGVTLGVDVELGQGVSLRGTTRVGRGAHVDDGAVLIDTVVGAHARVAPYTVAVGAEIAPGAVVGPLVSLGPGKPPAMSAAAKVAANGARNGAAAPTARLKRATRKSVAVRARG